MKSSSSKEAARWSGFERFAGSLYIRRRHSGSLEVFTEWATPAPLIISAEENHDFSRLQPCHVNEIRRQGGDAASLADLARKS
jgi:hypothetical protein